MKRDADEPDSVEGHPEQSAPEGRRWADTLFPGQHYVGPEFDETVGQNVARFRKAMGLSQADLAAEISGRGEVIHQQTIQKIEKGTRPLKYSEAIRICTALGITPIQLGDPPPLAHSNANFQSAIQSVTKVQSELLSNGTQLVDSLLALAELVGLSKAGVRGFQPDQYLLDYAEKLLQSNWGAVLNERILVELRTRYRSPDELALQVADAASSADALRKVTDHTMRTTNADGANDDSDA